MAENTIEVEAGGTVADYKLSLWLKDLLPRTPGAERKVVQQELINTLREFFNVSSCWRKTLVYDLKSGKTKYYLSPEDSYSNVIRVHRVTVDGRALNFKSSKFVVMPSENDGTTPTSYYTPDPDVVVIDYAPSETVTDGIEFYVSLTPNRNVKRVPEIAVTQYYDVILDGVLGRLMMHPAKPYSNPMAAQYHLRRFRSGVADAKAKGNVGNIPGQNWTYPPFA